MAISFQSTLSLGTGNTPRTNLASKMSGKIAAGAKLRQNKVQQASSI